MRCWCISFFFFYESNESKNNECFTPGGEDTIKEPLPFLLFIEFISLSKIIVFLQKGMSSKGEVVVEL